MIKTYADFPCLLLGIQMNQVYAGSAATAIAESDIPPSLEGINLLKEVVLSTYPGFHLPHVWLAASGQSPRVSSLDLCGHGRFTVLTGIGGQCWLDAANTLGKQSSLPEIAAYSIGFRCDYTDCYRDWQRVRGCKDDGVVLVRPDHFVAWRFASASSNATELLRQALEKVMMK